MNQEKDVGCCHVEGIVNVDSRGQIVLPKSLRDSMGLSQGDRLVVIAMKDKGVITSISLMKADAVDNMVKVVLKPTMEEILKD
ncbi:MAG: AbrB/MazE/SpoVT family DNA-binding domain-containing protein [Candidatus Heimdallarchaeota archaeon]|nr:AbrB/MazE/SpoVT family DNA-binding domain-containing protein [Candidatus Heimdallarchaeota archaeon]